MKATFKLICAGSIFAAASSVSFAKAECGDVTIADMNWSSATLIANIDKLILEEGFGCTVDLVPGDTLATATSLIEKGNPHIAPELWTNGVSDVLEVAVNEGKVKYLGRSLKDGGVEALWVPKYLVDQNPELGTIEGIKKNAELFEHPEDPDAHMYMGCPAGWNCQLSNQNLYRAFDMADAGFELVDPGSGAGLAGSIAKAYEREEAWFGYYWAPTALLGKYEMVRVDLGVEVNDEHWTGCIAKPECADPQKTDFPASDVWTVVATSFADESPEIAEYLAVRTFGNDEMNSLLAWMEDNQADGEFGAYYFLEEYPEVWEAWVSEDVAEAVKSAL